MRSMGMALMASALLAGAATAAELRIGHSDLPLSGNPMCCTSNTHGYTLQAAYDHLTYIDDKGNAVGGILESWTNPERNRWVVKVRSNVKFHNGRTLNVDDIVDQFTYYATDEGKAKAVAIVRNLGAIKEVRKVDASTIEIETRVPNPIMMSEVGMAKAVDMKHFADVGFDGYGTRPVGTGPYKPITWARDRVTLESHKDGWRPGKIDKVTIMALPEPPSRLQAFQSNQIEIAMQITSDARQAVTRAGGRLHTASAPSILTLMFQSNPNGPAEERVRTLIKPSTDVRVRQALNYAVNREEYLKAIIGEGITVATGQPAPRTVRGYQPDIKAYPYDPAKARALLSAAGYGSGLKLQAEVVNNVSELNDTYLKVGQDLARVGVELEIRPITLADLIARSRAQKAIEGQLFSFDMGSFPTMDMMRSINALHSCNARTKWICFQDIEPTIKAVNEEFDPAKRKQLLLQVARYYRENAPAIFLHEEVQVDAVSNKVRGYNPVNRLVNWHEIDLQ